MKKIFSINYCCGFSCKRVICDFNYSKCGNYFISGNYEYTVNSDDTVNIAGYKV